MHDDGGTVLLEARVKLKFRRDSAMEAVSIVVLSNSPACVELEKRVEDGGMMAQSHGCSFSSE
jgi:hypothetical protein